MKKIEIEKIRQNVSQKHQKFISDAGWQSRKLGADYTYNIERMSAKVKLILNIFKEEGVISKYEEIDRSGPNHGNREVQVFVDGYEKVANIEIFGNVITIQDATYRSFEREAAKIIIEEIDEYDWEDFANRLLDYIHQTIYMRKESYNLKIWGD